MAHHKGDTSRGKKKASEEQVQKGSQEPLAEPRNESRFRVRLRKYENLITFIGAMIVFFTYSYKEQVAENLKQKSEELRQAETAYSNMSRTLEAASLSGSPGDILEKERDLEEDYYEDNPRQKVDAILDVRPFLYKTLLEKRLLFNSQEDLAIALPSTVSWDLREDIISIAHRIDNEIDYLHDMPELTKEDLHKKSKKQQDDLTRTILRFYEGFDKEGEEIEKDLEKGTTHIVAEAKEQAIRAKEKYELATKIGYVLYTLGWGLGLFSKIFKVGSVGLD